MNDQNDKVAGRTATAEPGHKPDRITDAGLGLFERVNELTGMKPIGVAPAIGGATEQEVDVDRLPGIVGVDRIQLSEEDDRYWREHHAKHPYANPASNYEEYQPAYQYGTDAAHRHRGRSWDHVQGDLERGWDKAKGDSSLAWEHAKHAVRAAWDRISGHPDRGSR